MHDLKAQDYIDDINKLREQEIYQKKEIERLRNDNSTKQEQIDRTKVFLNNRRIFKILKIKTGKNNVYSEGNQRKKGNFG